MNKFAGKTLLLASLALTILLAAGSTALASEQKATPAFTLTPQRSFEALVAGNARFVAGEATHLRQDVARRAERRRPTSRSVGDDTCGIPAKLLLCE